MRKIIGYSIVGILVISAILPCVVSAGDPTDPEVKDKRFDVKLFGFLGGLPQVFFKHIDIVSAWFDEDSENPEYLYVSLKVRELKEHTEFLEAIYRVSWNFNYEEYGTVLKLHSGGIYGDFYVYRNLGDNHAHDEVHTCDGVFDTENSIITWKIAKEDIGNLRPGHVLTTPSAITLLRHFNETTLTPGPDIFKDLTTELFGFPDRGYGKDYKIKY